jgi:hypothetical protein
MSSISSIVLKNVVDELQKNVQAEMSKFQLQIGALDSILRHIEPQATEAKEPVEVKELVEPKEPHNPVGMQLRLMDVKLMNEDLNRRLTKTQDLLEEKCNEVDDLKKTVNSIQDKLTQLLEMSTKLSIDFNNHYVHSQVLHTTLDNKVTALRSYCDEFIQNKTAIENEVFAVPHNTPESSVEEPDIVDEVDLAAEAEETVEAEEEEAVEEEEAAAEEEEAVEEEEGAAEEEAAEEAAEDEETVGVADAEEEGEEMEEIEYKGRTYYVDSDNIAYVLDDSGELEEDPVGQWVPEKKIMRFYKK